MIRKTSPCPKTVTIFRLSNAAEIMLLFPFVVFVVFDDGRKRQHDSNAKKYAFYKPVLKPCRVIWPDCVRKVLHCDWATAGIEPVWSYFDD